MNMLSKIPETKTTSRDAAQNGRLVPLANILETEDGYVVEAEMPGVGKDGLDVTVENGELVIVGHRSAGALPGTTLYREKRGLDYRRVFEMDSSIDTGKIVAKIEQGVLKLHLPKSEAVKPHRIAVTD